MDKDDKTRIPWPDRNSVAWQKRKLSDWWNRTHQMAGLPYSCMTSLIDFPHATRGALRERAEGWKWWMPHVMLAVPRGGYGALFLYLSAGRKDCALKLEESEVAEQLRIAGNRVELAKHWEAATQIIAEYVAGNMVRPEE